MSTTGRTGRVPSILVYNVLLTFDVCPRRGLSGGRKRRGRRRRTGTVGKGSSRTGPWVVDLLRVKEDLHLTALGMESVPVSSGRRTKDQ